MNDSKLLNTAKNLSKLIPDSDTVSDIYISFLSLVQKHSNIFYEVYDKNDLLKLSILICLIKRNEVPNYEKVFNNLSFITLISSDLEHAEEECDKCNGYGLVDCNDCNGNGYIICSECDGNQLEECTECYGIGFTRDGERCSNCYGTGNQACNYCSGSGEIKCNFCDNSGYIDCSNCDREGTVKTNLMKCYITQIISWDPKLNDRALYCEGTLNPLFRENNLYSYPKLILSNFSESNFDLIEQFKPDSYYVIDVEDAPDFTNNKGKRFTWSFPTEKLSFIEK